MSPPSLKVSPPALGSASDACSDGDCTSPILPRLSAASAAAAGRDPLPINARAGRRAVLCKIASDYYKKSPCEAQNRPLKVPLAGDWCLDTSTIKKGPFLGPLCHMERWLTWLLVSPALREVLLRPCSTSLLATQNSRPDDHVCDGVRQGVRQLHMVGPALDENIVPPGSLTGGDSG